MEFLEGSEGQQQEAHRTRCPRQTRRLLASNGKVQLCMQAQPPRPCTSAPRLHNRYKHPSLLLQLPLRLQHMHDNVGRDGTPLQNVGLGDRRGTQNRVMLDLLANHGGICHGYIAAVFTRSQFLKKKEYKRRVAQDSGEGIGRDLC